MNERLLKIGLSMFIISFLMFSTVYASETIYAVSSNVEGLEVLGGTPVTITASTLDSTVNSVTFRWVGPQDGIGDCSLEETVPVYTNGTLGYLNSETPAQIRYAESTYIIYEGKWKVEIIFQNSEGTSLIKELFAIGSKGTQPVFHTPEIPLGTIGATMAMALALGLFLIKKRKNQK
jgi:hypothetical protein